MSFDSLYKMYFILNAAEYKKLYLSRYNSESTITFDCEINGNPAFFFFHNNINILLNQISEMEEKVENAFNRLPKLAKQQFIKKTMIDEIVYSNEIEGVISTRKDINTIIENIKCKDDKLNRLDGIVKKYLTLLDGVDLKIESSEDVRKLYNESFLEEVISNDPKNEPDGNIFRKGPVFITSSGKEIHRGICPESELIKFVDKGLDILHNNDIHPLIRLSIFHYLFAYAHPFYDGNGRINRLISSYFISKKYSALVGYNLSMMIKANISRYYEAFKHTNDVRNKGDMTTFVYEFLSIILGAFEKTELFAMEYCHQLKKYFDIITNLNISDKAKDLLNVLVQSEVFTELGVSASELMKINEISVNTLKKYLAELSNLSILKEVYLFNRKYYGIDLDKLGNLK